MPNKPNIVEHNSPKCFKNRKLFIFRDAIDTQNHTDKRMLSTYPFFD